MSEPPKTYLEYLDKEMTIMGILSTFCFAVAALVIDRIIGASKDQLFFAALWIGYPASIVAVIAGFSAAGGVFYKQRSDLAWFYGQISLSMVAPNLNLDTKGLYRNADSWRTWSPYRWAFFLLTTGVLLALRAVCEAACIVGPPWLRWLDRTLYGGLLICAVLLWFLTVIRHHYQYKDDPWHAFLAKKGKRCLVFKLAMKKWIWEDFPFSCRSKRATKRRSRRLRN